MKAIDFPQRNLMLAENQPEYETLPVFTEIMKTEAGNMAALSMIACFELTDEEVMQVIKTRKLWYRQMLFGKNFQPMIITVENPFE